MRGFLWFLWDRVVWRDEYLILQADRSRIAELMREREADRVCLEAAWAEVNRRIGLIENERKAAADAKTGVASRAASKMIQKYKWGGD